MLSAGLLGGPGIGFKQDKFASEKLQEISPDTYARFKADKENKFLNFTTNGLNGTKVSTLDDNGKKLAGEMEILTKPERKTKISRASTRGGMKQSRLLQPTLPR